MGEQARAAQAAGTVSKGDGTGGGRSKAAHRRATDPPSAWAAAALLLRAKPGSGNVLPKRCDAPSRTPS